MLRIALIWAMTASAAFAQAFTTSAEVKPILVATKPNWIAVREFNGQDLVYFTQILSWRCGVSEIRYSVNGGAMKTFPEVACHKDTNAPNAILPTDPLPYLEFGLGSVASVSVTLIFDDGSEESGTFERSAVLMP